MAVTDYLVMTAGGKSLNAGLTQYNTIAGDFTAASGEAVEQTPARTAITFKNLRVHVFSNTLSAAATATFRKNTAAGNLTVSIATTLTGGFEDITHTDVVAVNDLMAYQLATAAGTGTIVFQSVCFTTEYTDTKNVQSWSCKRLCAINFGATSYCPISGAPTIGTTSELYSQTKYYNPTTFSLARFGVESNTCNGATVFTFRKNGVNGNITASVPANTTGGFQDLVNSDSVVSGDLACYGVVAAGSSGAMSYSNTVTLTVSNAKVLWTGTSSLSALSAGAARYGWLEGAILGWSTTEASEQIKAYVATIFDHLYFYTDANTVNGTSTFDLRANSGSTALTLSIGASTTGAFEDVTHKYQCATTDLLCFRLAAGGSTGTIKAIVSSVTQSQVAGFADVTSDAATTDDVQRDVTSDAAASMSLTSDVTSDSATQVAATRDVTSDSAATTPVAINVTSDAAATAIVARDVTSDSATQVVAVRNVTSDLAAQVAATRDVTSDLAAQVAVAANITSDAVTTITAVTNITTDADVVRALTRDVTSDSVLTVPSVTDVTTGAAITFIAGTTVITDTAVSVAASADVVTSSALSMSGLKDITSDAATLAPATRDVTTDASAIAAAAVDVLTDAAIARMLTADVTTTSAVGLIALRDVASDAATTSPAYQDVTTSAAIHVRASGPVLQSPYGFTPALSSPEFTAVLASPAFSPIVRS